MKKSQITGNFRNRDPGFQTLVCCDRRARAASAQTFTVWQYGSKQQQYRLHAVISPLFFRATYSTHSISIVMYLAINTAPTETLPPLFQIGISLNEHAWKFWSKIY